MIAYKIVVVLCVIVIAFFLYRMAITGMAVKASGHGVKEVAIHRHTANTLGWMSLGLVLLIEIGVRLKGGSKMDVTFFMHMVPAVFYAVSLITLLFWYDGTHPYHKILAYFCMASFVGVAYLGIPMLLERFTM